MHNPFSLEGKTILVTGASSGIGRSIAVESAKLGATLIITGRDEQRLTQTLTGLVGTGHIMKTADLSNDAELNELVSFVPQIDGVAHVAGIVKPKPFQFLNREELESVMEINFYAPVLLTNLIIRGKKIKKNASIVFISSISGSKVSFVAGSSYSASKGALNGIVKGMAIDLASKNIRVNTVIPGMIETGIFDGSGVSNDDLAEDRKRYPLRRYGKPEEVAYAAIYLLSDASAWTTGSNILLDGGYTLI